MLTLTGFTCSGSASHSMSSHSMQATVGYTVSLTEPSTSGTCSAPVLLSYSLVVFLFSLCLRTRPSGVYWWSQACWLDLVWARPVCVLEHNSLCILPCFGQWTWLIPLSRTFYIGTFLIYTCTDEPHSSRKVASWIKLSYQNIGYKIISNSLCMGLFHLWGETRRRKLG